MAQSGDLAADLEALLFGGLDEEACKSKWTARVRSPWVDAIWANLQHYLDD